MFEEHEGVEHYRRLIRAHLYDKCWQIDITWAEVEQLLDGGEIIEETNDSQGRSKRIRLLEGWGRPLHVVEVIDTEQELIVYVTIYEPHRTAGGPASGRGGNDLMTCVACGRGQLVEKHHPRVVEREGRVAVVRGVPVLLCESCGEVYLDTEVAKQLDILFRRLLDGPVDHVVAHYAGAAVA